MIYYVGNNEFLKKSYQYQKCTLEDAISYLEKLEYIGLDTETSGLDCHSKKLLTIQMGDEKNQFVFDIASYNYVIPQPLKQFLNGFEGTFILQNAKFDLQFFYKQHVILRHVYDTMLAETILTLGLQKGGRDLKTLVQKYCNEYLDKSVRGQIITHGLSPEVIVYGARDVQFLEHIMIVQKNQADRLDLTGALKLDNEFVKCLAYIEYCGVKLDWNKWKNKALGDMEALEEAKNNLESWLWDNGYKHYFSAYNLFAEKPECTINWNSEQQVIPLFKEIGVNCTVIEEGKEKDTIERKALQFQIKDFPILQLYYAYSAQQKLVSTYGLKWESVINPVTNRIHTSYKQIMNTGRLSCGEKSRGLPNLQNLPNNSLTRSCFIAEPGNKFIAVDYSSQESIVLANFAHDKSLINFYQKGLQDMHSYVAFLLFPEIQKSLNKTPENLTNDDLICIKEKYHDFRQTAKTAEFAIKSYFRLFS